MPVAQLVLDAAGIVPAQLCCRSHDRPAGPASLAAGGLADALASRVVSTVSLGEGLRDVADGARRAAGGARQLVVAAEESATATAESASGLDEQIVRARIRYDQFFNVRRVRSLSARELRLGILDTVARACEDAQDAPVGLTELVELLRGMQAMLAAAENDDPTEELAAPPPSTMTGDRGASEEERAMWRWVTGHHVVALCCEFARLHLERAERGLEPPGDPDTLAAELALAETFVRAVGAAMSYAATLPRWSYIDHVRPLMDAASEGGHGFSGVDNYDYLLMREGWERLHDSLIDDIPASARHRSVDAAALRLFEAVVEESERHTLIAAAMVGNEPSLMQVREITVVAGGHGTPAVEALRQNTDHRRELLDSLTARFLAAAPSEAAGYSG